MSPREWRCWTLMDVMITCPHRGIICEINFLFALFQEKNLDWFPRMRAMSLVSSEGENEQNEIRNLQEKLDSTMSLVKQLSGQLAELKEQVGDGDRGVWTPNVIDLEGRCHLLKEHVTLT